MILAPDLCVCPRDRQELRVLPCLFSQSQVTYNKIRNISLQIHAVYDALKLKLFIDLENCQSLEYIWPILLT